MPLTKDFHYDLPKELIAQCPATPRDHSRLLVLNNDKTISHKRFYDLPEYLRAGDALVINETRVMPARLIGTVKNGGTAEILLLKRLNLTDWEALSKPGRRTRPGDTVRFSEELSGEIVGLATDGARIVRFSYDGAFEEILDRLGKMPLPPYITRALDDPARYQTVYARETGSAAAPTAGLHFTPDLLLKIANKGVSIAPVTLHVGLGTFRPVKEEDASNHVMHSEYFEIANKSCGIINAARENGGRIVCVGTTTVRTLESAFEGGKAVPKRGETDIYITPGYDFKAADMLITNFHLPESTLLMLVSAFIGRETALALYKTAVDERYRFFSFGDAMLLPKLSTKERTCG